MTILVQTLHNYSMRPLAELIIALFKSIGKVFVRMFNAFVEARHRQAAWEVSRQLKMNRDFDSYSQIDLYNKIMDGNNTWDLKGEKID